MRLPLHKAQSAVPGLAGAKIGQQGHRHLNNRHDHREHAVTYNDFLYVSIYKCITVKDNRYAVHLVARLLSGESLMAWVVRTKATDATTSNLRCHTHDTTSLNKLWVT